MLRRWMQAADGLPAGRGDAWGEAISSRFNRLGHRDDLRVRMHADTAGVQPCGLS